MGVYYVAGIPYGQTDELYHYGRKGMKWGQNVFTTWAEYMQGLGKKIGGAVNNARNAAREYATGNNARSALGEAIRNRENVNQARSAYNRTLPGQVQNLRRNAGNAFNNARNQAGQAFNNARNQAGQAFNNARNAVSTAYAEAAKKAGGAGKNIEQFYNDVMANAQDKIRAGKQMVSAYGNQAMSSIQELGKKALEGPKNWLDAMLKRARNAKKELSKGAGYLSSKAGEAVNKAKDSAVEYVTGAKSKKKLNSAKKNYENAHKAYKHDDKSVGGGLGSNRPGQLSSFDSHVKAIKKREAYEQAQSEYDKTLPGQLNKLKKKIKR